MRNIIFIILLSFVQVAHAYSYRPAFEPLNPKAFEFSLHSNYFESTSFVDSKGVEVPADTASFVRLEHQLMLAYGYGKKLELNGGILYRENQYTENSATLSSTGIDSYFMGARYLVKSFSGWNLLLKGSAGKTSHENKLYAPAEVPRDKIVLGDSGNQLSFSGIIGKNLTNKQFLFLEIGHRMPGDELSPEFFYVLEGGLHFTTKFSGRIGAEGIYSRGADSYTQTPTEKPLIDHSKSKLYNSINREWIAPYAMIDYSIAKNWLISLGAKSTISAISSDKGNTYLFELTYNTGGISKEDEKIEKFKEYHVDATVIGVSPRGKFLKIDKGAGDDLVKGMKFDIYQTDYFGGNLLVASAVVYQVSADNAILSITKIYNSEIKIKEGFSARGAEQILE